MDRYSRLYLYIDADYISPYAMSVFVVLREKGVEFDMIQVDLNTGEHLTPGYFELSNTRRVPTLTDGEFSLSESSAIAEFLDDVFPDTRVLPEDPYQRAKARQIQAWLRSDLAALREERSTLVVFCGQKGPALTPAAVTAANKLIDASLKLLPDDREHLFGEWSIADVDLALMLNRLILNGDAVPERLVEYAKRQWQRPSVQEWVGLERKVI